VNRSALERITGGCGKDRISGGFKLHVDPWTPLTLEDRLLERYVVDQPGVLFLEVNVGGRDLTRGPRRLDGVLVPGPEVQIRPQHSYNVSDVAAAVDGSVVHVLEAKRRLNRNVIGQVEVGMALFERDFTPDSVVGVAVCANGNADLEWYCSERSLRTAIYRDVLPMGSGIGTSDASDRLDLRKPPDPARKNAFLKGWEDAAGGQLYDSIRTRKTHANMGNLFGWIYGDMPTEFRDATWDRYVASIEQDRTSTGS
jgi:hypothetical protein